MTSKESVRLKLTDHNNKIVFNDNALIQKEKIYGKIHIYDLVIWNPDPPLNELESYIGEIEGLEGSNIIEFKQFVGNGMILLSLTRRRI